MGSQNLKPSFITCEKCGKRLIERQRNGIFHFMFGKPKNETTFVPVDIFIQGNIKIKCTRRSCNHWQILSYLPPGFEISNQSDNVPKTPTVQVDKQINESR